MITSALRDTRLLWLTISMVLLAGYFSFESLPRMEDPVLTERAAMINTSVPGASARRVEALVSHQLVKNLRLFEEVKEVRSISVPIFLPSRSLCMMKSKMSMKFGRVSGTS